MLLLIDNYDSFAHNLARYFVQLGCDVSVVRNDAITVDQLRILSPQAIVLSPGPCTPKEAGCSLPIVVEFHRQVPILGICLGHQTIVAALGGDIERCEPRHGRTSLVDHQQQGVFRDVPTPFRVCRYHSLAATAANLPAELAVSARSDDGTIMAVTHRAYPVVGLQFHPESILTEHGYQLLANFLTLAGIEFQEPIPSLSSQPWHAGKSPELKLQGPVTF